MYETVLNILLYIPYKIQRLALNKCRFPDFWIDQKNIRQNIGDVSGKKSEKS